MEIFDGSTIVAEGSKFDVISELRKIAASEVNEPVEAEFVMSEEESSIHFIGSGTACCWCSRYSC